MVHNQITACDFYTSIQKPTTIHVAAPTTLKPTTIIPITRPPSPTTAAAAPATPRTCAEIYESGYTTSGDYTIDPDGDGDVSQFVVYCDMEGGRGKIKR